MSNVDARWSIKGLKELAKDLRKLSLMDQAKALRAANRKAGNSVVVKKLEQASPYKMHKERRATKKDRFRRVNVKTAITTTVKGSKTAVRSGINGKYYYYRFLEFGTIQRKTKKGYGRGRMAARPAFNPALDRSVNPLFRFLKTEYGKILDKIIKRKAKK